MTINLEALPIGTDEIADWLELYLLKANAKGINTQRLLDAAKEQIYIEEHTFALAMNTLVKRSQLTANYPFLVDEIAVRLKEDYFKSAYTLLLMLSRPSNLMKWQTASPSLEEIDVFEGLVCNSLRNYLGTNSEAIPFGWPSKFGRPENFNEAIKWLAGKIGIQTGAMYRPPRRKDGGVDVVAWRRFPDNRSGFQVGLVQCTLQQNYVSKSRDIDLRIWSGWLDLERDPMTILAIPKAVPNDEQWNEATANSIVFERMRLSYFHSECIDETSQVYLQKVLSKLRK